MHLLHRIFDLNPRKRITLPELRREIIEMDTFFLSDKEVLRCTKAARDVASFFAPLPSKFSHQKQKYAMGGNREEENKHTGCGADSALQAEVKVVQVEEARSDSDPTTDSLPVQKAPSIRKKAHRSSIVKVVGRILGTLGRTSTPSS